jgi:hypothetical protein
MNFCHQATGRKLRDPKVSSSQGSSGCEKTAQGGEYIANKIYSIKH